MDVGTEDAAAEDVERVADVADRVSRKGLCARFEHICAVSAENVNIPHLDIEPPVRAGREDLQPAQTIVKE